MSEGPTTVGSIIAKLNIDKSQFDVKRDEAKADAAQLGSLDPTIKVDAKVGDALAKLEAVRLAEENLGNSTDRLKIAYQKLDEVQTKGGASESRLMQLHLSAARAEQQHEAATRKLADAQNALNDANRVGEVFAQREGQSGSSGGGNAAAAAGPAGLIAVGVAALIPLVASLAGYLAAVTGAFAGMGAAGLLAVLGIAHAMSDGTAAGNQFSAGLQILRGNLNDLEASAASGMLVPFQASISLINSSMSSLNAEINTFAKMLGTTGTIILSTLITGFQILNPLFVEAGVYIEQLAAGWERWTANGGLAKFAHDASAALPQVAQALGALVGGVLSLIGAFAPLGTVLLGVVTILGNFATILTTVLGPAFLPVVAGAAAAVTMFMQWKVIGPIIEQVAWELGALGTAADAAAGPIGWIIGAVSLVAAGFAALAVSTDAASKAQQNYTAAVQADNGVIGKAVAAQAAKALADRGALAVATQLGFATKTLTQATLGNVVAQDQLKARIDFLNSRLKAMDLANESAATHTGAHTAEAAKLASQLQTLTQAYESEKQSIQNSIKAYNDIASAQGLATISTKKQLDAQVALAATYGMSVSQMLTAEAAQKANADQAAATTMQLQMENDAATLLTNAFTLLNGGLLSVAQAQTGAAAATNTLIDSFKQNGKAIDGNTKAAVANQQALESKVAADQQAAEAIAKQTGSTQAGTKAFQASKQALIEQLRATGQLTPAIQALIDKLYAIPPVVKTKAEMDAAAAIANANALKAALAGIPRNISVTVATNSVGAPGNVAVAPGKTVKFADGGTVGGTGGPKADTVAAWLSVGEEVTPNPQAARYRSALKALAVDNVSGARRALGGGGSSVVNNFTIYEAVNPTQLAQAVANRQNARAV
jgi:hypothetical protein